MIKVSSGMFLLFFFLFFASLSFELARVVLQVCVLDTRRDHLCLNEAVALSGCVEGLLHYD